MSSEKPPADRLIEAASDLCEQTLHRVHGPGGRRSGADAIAPGLVAVASEGASGTADLARQVAGAMLRGAATVGGQLVDAAGQLESVVTDRPRDASRPAPRTGDDGARAPAELVLPPAQAGAETATRFDVVNRGRDPMKRITLRCNELRGPGGRRIPGASIALDPNPVPVDARATTRITCTVKVPPSTRRGTYTGSIEAPDHGVRLAVSLTVE